MCLGARLGNHDDPAAREAIELGWCATLKATTPLAGVDFVRHSSDYEDALRHALSPSSAVLFVVFMGDVSHKDGVLRATLDTPNGQRSKYDVLQRTLDIAAENPPSALVLVLDNACFRIPTTKKTIRTDAVVQVLRSCPSVPSLVLFPIPKLACDDEEDSSDDDDSVVGCFSKGLCEAWRRTIADGSWRSLAECGGLSKAVSAELEKDEAPPLVLGVAEAAASSTWPFSASGHVLSAAATLSVVHPAPASHADDNQASTVPSATRSSACGDDDDRTSAYVSTASASTARTQRSATTELSVNAPSFQPHHDEAHGARVAPAARPTATHAPGTNVPPPFTMHAPPTGEALSTKGAKSRHCDACGCEVFGETNWKLHVDSEKHKRKTLLLQMAQTTDEPIDATMAALVVNPKNFFKCDVCNVLISGQTNIDQHLAGNQHQKLAAKQPRMCEKCDVELPNQAAYTEHVESAEHIARVLATVMNQS